MFTVQRIYAYRPDPEQTAVFIERLYPRGIRKEVFATSLWLKDIAPSANLRRWYHENPAEHFDGFVSRYHEELHCDTEQAAIRQLLELERQHGSVLLLTAVKDPHHSHVSALEQFLGTSFEYRD